MSCNIKPCHSTDPDLLKSILVRPDSPMPSASILHPSMMQLFSEKRVSKRSATTPQTKTTDLQQIAQLNRKIESLQKTMQEYTVVLTKLKSSRDRLIDLCNKNTAAASSSISAITCTKRPTAFFMLAVCAIIITILVTTTT